MPNQFAFFKAWMAYQETIKDLSAVYVLDHDTNIASWPEATMHPIPTLVLSVDMHLRIKTSVHSHLDLQPLEAVIIKPGALHAHIKPRHPGRHYSHGFLESYSDFHLHVMDEVYH
ncbi:MAG: hypothetical protein HRU15_06305, partial [Planctomycetes bacterium]|nr:hypothetical protein [Planctomycetota bacterium]